ncbi:MAG: helix-turn-helix transcriptional regulator [Acidobacteriota bacterium]|nr:helix-turn-helix transcriptional regulator [Acidobacteriota bacterium]
MAHKVKKKLTSKPKARARVFAALGDRTRVALVAQLAVKSGASIAELGAGIEMTRQAVTKHLEVLERAGVVRSRLAGRERLFELEREPLEGAREFLEVVVEKRIK